VLVHLRRGSVHLAPGDPVRAGQQVAECGNSGNSGNSSEPHVHVQLMDHPRVSFAAGLPVEFEEFEVDGERRRGVPRDGTPFVVPS